MVSKWVDSNFLWFSYVIHTVGPRYNQKYKTAAESALFNCYRRTLQLLRSVSHPVGVGLADLVWYLGREHKLETIGLSVINSSRRGYPPEEGAHIAIRMSCRMSSAL